MDTSEWTEGWRRLVSERVLIANAAYDTAVASHASDERKYRRATSDEIECIDGYKRAG